MSSPGDWSTRLIHSGGCLRSFAPSDFIPAEPAARLAARLAHATLAWSGPKRRSAAGSGVIGERTASLAHRILTRGAHPPIHPEAERKLLHQAALLDDAQPADLEDLVPQIAPGAALPTEWDVLEVVEWLDQKAREGTAAPPMARLVAGPAHLSRLTQALLHAIQRAWLPAGETWTIAIRDSTSSALDVLVDALELIRAAETLTGENLTPRECWCSVNDGRPFILRRIDVVSFETLPAPPEQLRPDLEIALEPELGPDDELPSLRGVPLVVVRAPSGDLQAAADSTDTSNTEVSSPSKKSRLALGWILQLAFAKRAFRPGQLEAIERLLAGESCVVSLPPGEGKSLVYQISGILRPDLTLVIEPSDLLADSQHAALAALGLAYRTDLEVRSEDSAPGRPVDHASRFAVFASGELRRPGGRARLQELIGSAPLGLVVIDDAECASEWSVRFDPAHAGLRRLLRVAGVAPTVPIVALVNDPREEVLRDVLAPAEDPEARPSLVQLKPDLQRVGKIEVVHSRTERALSALQGLLKALPKRFGLPAERFYDASRPDGPRGLVLCSRLDGPFGLLAVNEAVRQTGLCSRIGLHAIEIPAGVDRQEFEEASRRDLDLFRSGRLPLLIAGSDLGYAFDPSPISYLVHLGLPPSLDALRAQAGRLRSATRQIERFIVTVPQSTRAVDRLLAPQTPHPEITARITERKGVFGEPDDLMRSLAAHVEWFADETAQVAQLDELCALVPWDTLPERASVSRSKEPRSRQRALHRLASLGVIEDWIEDDKSDEFVLTLPADASRVLDEHFWRCVLRTAPATAREVYEETAEREEAAPFPRTLSLRAGRVVSLVNTETEATRRSSIAELSRLVRKKGQAEIPEPEGLFLDRLPRRLAGLGDKGPRRIATWTETLDDLLPQEIPALQNFLSTLPVAASKNPGPALVRTLLDILDRGKQAGFRDHLRRTLEEVHMASGGDWNALRRLFAWLMPRVRAFAPAWSVNVWTAWEEASGELEEQPTVTWPGHLLRASEIRSLADPWQKPDEAIIVLERRLREAQSILETLTEHYAMEESEL